MPEFLVKLKMYKLSFRLIVCIKNVIVTVKSSFAVYTFLAAKRVYKKGPFDCRKIVIVAVKSSFDVETFLAEERVYKLDNIL